MKPPVLLIDLSALFRAAWHVIPSDGSPNVAYESTLSAVNRCVNMTRERFALDENVRLRVGICCDGKGNWRKAIAPEYKAHREAQPASMYGMLDRVKDTLRKDAFLLWECEGYEADDLIGAATDALDSVENYNGPGVDKEVTQIVIASHDKDLCQLSSPDVLMLKTHTWVWSDMADVVSKFGVKPFQIVDYLSLIGDKADNVEGCPGCGPATASSLIGRHGTVEKLYEYIESVKVTTDPLWRTSNGKSPLAILDKLLQAKEKVLLAKKLVRLKYDAPIDIGELEMVRIPQKRIDTGVKFDDTDFDFGDTDKEMKEIEDRVFGKKEEPEINPATRVTGQSATTDKASADVPPATTTPAASTAAPSVVADGKTEAHVKGTEPETAKEAWPAGEYRRVTSGANVAQQIGMAPMQSDADAASHFTESRAKAKAPETALATVLAPGEYERQLEPRSTGGAVAMGELIYNSGLYPKFKNPQACTVALVRGREMGYGALASMDMFEVVKDKLCPKAHLIINLGMTHPGVEYMYKSGESQEPGKEYAEYTIRLKSWPKGIEQKHRYTIAEAVDAGLATFEKVPRNMTKGKDGSLPRDDRSQWDKRRPEMLRKTAGVQCVRIYLPGAGLGLTSWEEMGGGDDD